MVEARGLLLGQTRRRPWVAAKDRPEDYQRGPVCLQATQSADSSSFYQQGAMMVVVLCQGQKLNI